MKFSEWLKIKEGLGKPAPPRKMVKIKRKEKISSGVRNRVKDLSKDYKGHLAWNGEVEPFKVLSPTVDEVSAVSAPMTRTDLPPLGAISQEEMQRIARLHKISVDLPVLALINKIRSKRQSRLQRGLTADPSSVK